MVKILWIVVLFFIGQSTLFAQCEPVDSLRVLWKSHNRIAIDWVSGGNDSDEYLISYVIHSAPIARTEVTVSGKTDYIITGLSANTLYDIDVFTMCSGVKSSLKYLNSIRTTKKDTVIQFLTKHTDVEIITSPGKNAILPDYTMDYPAVNLDTEIKQITQQPKAGTVISGKKNEVSLIVEHNGGSKDTTTFFANVAIMVYDTLEVYVNQDTYTAQLQTGASSAYFGVLGYQKILQIGTEADENYHTYRGFIGFNEADIPETYNSFTFADIVNAELKLYNNRASHYKHILPAAFQVKWVTSEWSEKTLTGYNGRNIGTVAGPEPVEVDSATQDFSIDVSDLIKDNYANNGIISFRLHLTNFIASKKQIIFLTSKENGDSLTTTKLIVGFAKELLKTTFYVKNKQGIPIVNTSIVCHEKTIKTDSKGMATILLPANNAYEYSIGETRGFFSVDKEEVVVVASYENTINATIVGGTITPQGEIFIDSAKAHTYSYVPDLSQNFYKIKINGVAQLADTNVYTFPKGTIGQNSIHVFTKDAAVDTVQIADTHDAYIHYFGQTASYNDKNFGDSTFMLVGMYVSGVNVYYYDSYLAFRNIDPKISDSLQNRSISRLKKANLLLKHNRGSKQNSGVNAFNVGWYKSNVWQESEMNYFIADRASAVSNIKVPTSTGMMDFDIDITEVLTTNLKGTDDVNLKLSHYDKGVVYLASKEHADSTLHPRLVLQLYTDKFAEPLPFEITTTLKDMTIIGNEKGEITLGNYTGRIYPKNPIGNVVSITQSPVAGTVLSGKTNTITFTATDDDGRTATKSINIDVEIPGPLEIISGVEDRIVVGTTEGVSQLVNYVNLVKYTGGVGKVKVSQYPAVGTSISGDSNRVTIKLIDEINDSLVVNFNIKVNKLFTLTPQTKHVLIPANEQFQGVIPDYTQDVVASGGEGTVQLFQHPAKGTVIEQIFPVIIKITAEDEKGHVATAEFFAEVIPGYEYLAITSTHTDTVLQGEENVEIPLPDFTTSVVVSGGMGTSSITQTPVAGTLVKGVNNSVTLTATDYNNDSKSVTFNVAVGSVTSTNLEELQPEILSVYPNPSIDKIHISSIETGEIIVVDCNERVVLAPTKKDMDISLLEKGIYYVILKQKGEIKSIRSFYKK